MNDEKQPPLISIIVPMYNVAEYITECLRSITIQSYSTFECFLIDDGSTDSTVSIVHSLIKDDARFTLIKQVNGGPAKARNRGLEQASGEYLLFVDSDDKLEENSLDVLLKTSLNEEADIVIGRTKRFDKEKTWDVPSHAKYGLNIEGEKKVETSPELFYAMGPAAKLIRRELVKTKVFDENKPFAEDQLFVFNAYLHAKKIFSISDTVYFYRVRDSDVSLTQTYRKNPVANIKLFTELMSEAEFDLKKSNNQGNTTILTLYFNRLFEIELRVLFKNILLSKSKEQVDFYQTFYSYFKTHTTQVISCSNFYQFIIEEQLKYLFLVKTGAVKELLPILKLSLNGEAISEKQQNQIKKLAKTSFIGVQGMKISAILRKLKSR